ncbi:MAG: NADP-dependent oxidoreductase [Simkania sp.]|nr:NADP-dependent oxidoreductase [Simkania sp.]
MKAVRFHVHGGPEVLRYEDVNTPTINADEVLIRVRSAGVSPFDAKVRRGYYKDFYGSLPHILGWDLSGDVVAIGLDISSVKKGDPVFGYIDAHRMGGAYAEYAILKKDEVSYKPLHVSYHEAAAVAMNGLTAWQALFDTAHLEKGQTVLIHAAAGGVGHLAVQFAKWKGAHVIGTASAKNREFVLSLGADECIDYTTTPFESAVKDIDLVLDTIGGDTLKKSFSAVTPTGAVVTITDFEGIKEAARYGVKGLTVFVKPNTKQLSEIGHLMEQGKLKVQIEKVFPLQEAEKAHILCETGHGKGKIILMVP